MKWSFSKAVQQRSGRTAKQSNKPLITNKLTFTTMDVSIVILTLVFLAMFLVPFLTISIMQKVKEHKKRKETHPKA